MADRSELTRTRLRSAWLFMAPMLIALALVAGWPLLRTIWFGFTDARLSRPDAYRFVGLSNYLADVDGRWIGLLANRVWWQAAWNTAWFALVSVAIETVLGIVVALVLDAKFPGRAIVRAAVLVPWAIPTVVSAKIWLWMLNDQFGIINHILMTLHLIVVPVAWTTGTTAMWSVIMVDVWKTTPFMALLVLAALQMLPTDCYEAARVDGVHPAKVFFKVTLPLIRPALAVAVIFRALDALRIFDLVYILTSGSRDTISMSGFARLQLVDFAKTGYGSAASTLLFLVIAVVTVLVMTAGRVRLSGDAAR
ncbi:carbohydrate ABC transporter permease [Labrys monachus]|uniref:Trehalose/maltose transport system permease protein n=1 Tax=Labrys monachus TaxID=217067 RepID=A0ABU0FDK9_9HYPH|nr:sugar ABC transporter permease [Labrys monachus]MDQ0392160.1 trehalose/maltose transport system permease protein [Labrys monachus]